MGIFSPAQPTSLLQILALPQLAVQPRASRFPSLKLRCHLSSADSEYLSCWPRTMGGCMRKYSATEGAWPKFKEHWQ